MLTPTEDFAKMPYFRSWIAVLSVDGRLSTVRVVYSDESQPESKEIAVVAAIMLNIDSQWEGLEGDFAGLPESWFGRREVKGRRLFRDLRKRRGPDSEEALRVLCAIPARRGIPIFWGAVDQQGFENARSGFMLPDTFSAHDAAFSGCLDSVDSYIETLVPWEKVLWIADVGNRPSHMKNLLAVARLESIHVFQEPKALLGTDTISTKRFRSHIEDTIYFGDSHESRALQLADVCCSVITGHLIGDRLVEPYYEMIRPRVLEEPAAAFKGVSQKLFEQMRKPRRRRRR